MSSHYKITILDNLLGAFTSLIIEIAAYMVKMVCLERQCTACVVTGWQVLLGKNLNVRRCRVYLTREYLMPPINSLICLLTGITEYCDPEQTISRLLLHMIMMRSTKVLYYEDLSQVTPP